MQGKKHQEISSTPTRQSIMLGDVARLSRLGVRDLSSFCDRWRVEELALFGSILRGDFRPGSDVDFLVTFSPGAKWSLFDRVAMQDELARLVGRKVDLVNRRAIEASRNRPRREAILDEARTIYAQG